MLDSVFLTQMNITFSQVKKFKNGEYLYGTIELEVVFADFSLVNFLVNNERILIFLQIKYY